MQYFDIKMCTIAGQERDSWTNSLVPLLSSSSLPVLIWVNLSFIASSTPISSLKISCYLWYSSQLRPLSTLFSGFTVLSFILISLFIITFKLATWWKAAAGVKMVIFLQDSPVLSTPMTLSVISWLLFWLVFFKASAVGITSICNVLMPSFPF